MSAGMLHLPMAVQESSDDLKAISYEDTKAAKPPIPITVIPPPPSRDGVSTSNRPKTSPEFYASSGKARSGWNYDLRRDSGMAPSSSTARDSRTTLATEAESLRNSPSLPRITIQDEASKASSTKQRKWSGYRAKKADRQVEQVSLVDPPFLGITTDIPTGSFEDLTLPGRVDFSHRGSMLIGGKKANTANGTANDHARLKSGRRQPSMSMLAALPDSGARVLSADDVMLSQKVRSMYESGNAMEQRLIAERLVGEPHTGVAREAVMGNPNGSAHPQARDSPYSMSSSSNDRATPAPLVLNNGVESAPGREETELAGGIEDWEDIRGGDVDRYGFIVPRRLPSQGSSMVSGHATSPEPPRIQRVSTLLLLASEAPRRKRSTLHRTPSNSGTARSVTASGPTRKLSGRSLRPRSSGSYQGSLGGTSSRFRQATNRLPYNKDRRWKDEAGDMLTLPPGLANIAENDEGSKAALDLKRKEWGREEKWRKMAKVVKKSNDGGGMVFEFDTKSPKLIERTWKGIPDRWRATAWHAFLTSSARRRGGLPSDDELVAAFHKLLDQSSPDDVQIDIDVPRTINSHIMFRRRYRGGQRLLFRVLHALSLYFPDTGYVQGMASLVATLLCYYEEETAFVMLVRLWQLRGLDRLYQSGFGGLMDALDEFEKKWLAGGEVATRLVR